MYYFFIFNFDENYKNKLQNTKLQVSYKYKVNNSLKEIYMLRLKIFNFFLEKEKKYINEIIIYLNNCNKFYYNS